MTALRIDNQYATGLSRQRIERARIDAGKDLVHLAPGDLGAVEDLHTSGRITTSRLAAWPKSPATTRCSTPGAALGAPPAISPTSSAAGSRPST
jgi:sarcosine/dimethylglycine N-methyltransferase